ncbi:hypothetical protein JW835_13350 [bacterium]|nr:hypothetical protein [bacterium]
MEKLKHFFHNLLNENGFPFQYAAIEESSIQFIEGHDFPWSFEVSEFPISIGKFDTHIDFILKHNKFPIYIICECKRANPAFSNWCFARSPHSHKHQNRFSPIIFDRMKHTSHGDYSNQVVTLDKQNIGYHIGYDIKSDKQGDKFSKGRGAFKDAVTQVIKGYNGFIDYFCSKCLVTGGQYFDVIPVIFTTANLWSSDIELNNADIRDGTISYESINFKEEEYIWFQENISQTLKHNIHLETNPVELKDVLDYYFTRSIGIINSKSIKKFLLYLDDRLRYIRKYE